MAQLGDTHNFGRSVTEGCAFGSEISSSVLFKPRTLFWEKIFFSESSEFCQVLLDEDERLSGLFGLKNVEIKKFSGLVEKVRSSEIGSETYTRSIFYFGQLLGYCYCLGIQDLHNDNVIQVGNHLQVIDCESVLSRLRLPDQTLLIPFKDVLFDDSAISLLGLSEKYLSVELCAEMLSGYFQILTLFKKCGTKLIQVLQALIDDERRRFPINLAVRVILRNTARYKRHLSEKEGLVPFKEEKIQLDRFDIPYFFKFIGEPKVYFFETPDLHYKEVELPEEFSKIRQNWAVDPADLISDARIDQDLIPTGGLQILRKFLTRDWRGKFVFNNFKISGSADSIELEIADKKFVTTAPPSDPI